MAKAPLDALFEHALPQALCDLAPIEPPAQVRARMRAHVLGRARAEAKARSHSFFTIRADEGKWHDIHPGVRLKLLKRDSESQTFLLEVAPNTVVPSHDHPSDEECYVMQGEAFIGTTRLHAGDYHFAYAGTRHTGLRSETGALLLIRTGADGPRIV